MYIYIYIYMCIHIYIYIYIYISHTYVSGRISSMSRARNSCKVFPFLMDLPLQGIFLYDGFPCIRDFPLQYK